jgi:flagellar hook-length control protein FliK
MTPNAAPAKGVPAESTSPPESKGFVAAVEAEAAGTSRKAIPESAEGTSPDADPCPKGNPSESPAEGVPAPPAAQGTKAASAARESSPGSAPALAGAPETVPDSGTVRKKRDEGIPRVEEHAEPIASSPVAGDRNAADKAVAVRQAPPPPPSRPVQFGESAFVLTRKSETSIEVTLAPPGVGKLEIEVVLDKGIVHANITAADPAGREAIARSLPHILDALARDGMSIGGFTVSLKERKGQAGDAPARVPLRGTGVRPAGSAVVPTVAASLGRVDLFV